MRQRVYSLFLFCFFVVSAGPETILPQSKASAEAILGKALHQEQVELQYESAIQSFRSVLRAPDVTRPIAARALFRIGNCLMRLGRNSEAQQTYEKLIRDFPDQKDLCANARSMISSLRPAVEISNNPAPVIRRLFQAAHNKVVVGSPSPDGRYLALFDRAGLLDIREPASGKIRSIDLDRAGNGLPWPAVSAAWSKDGRFIGYMTSGSEFCVIRVADLQANKFQIGSDGVVAWDWYPEGESIIAITRKEELLALTRLSTTDGTTQQLRMFPGNVLLSEAIKISPDGRFAAYDCRKPGSPIDSNIYAWPLSGGTDTAITAYGSADRLVDWSPDGKSIYFVSDRGGAPGLWSIPINRGKASGDAVLVKSDLGYVQPWGITKGGAFYYASHQHREDVLLARVNLQSGYVSSPPKPIHPYRLGANSSPLLSQDGNFLAYICDEVGPGSPPGTKAANPPVCISGLRNGDERQLRIDAGPGAIHKLYTWTADEKEIMAAAGKGVILRIDAGNGRILARYDLEADAMLPDGKTAILQRRDPKTLLVSIMAHDLIAGSERQLYRSDRPAATRGLVPSPDGTWLLFNHDVPHPIEPGDNLTVLSVETKDFRVLQHSASDGHIYSFGWSLGGRDVLWSLPESKDSPTMRIWTLPLAGGAPLASGVTGSMVRDMTFSPDGDSLVFASGQISPVEVWAIENCVGSRNRGKAAR
jgi:WD40 repeat protein